MDSMVRTTMTIEREVDDTWNTKIRVLKLKGGRAILLYLARKRSIVLPLREGIRDKAAAIGAKARSGLLAS